MTKKKKKQKFKIKEIKKNEAKVILKTKNKPKLCVGLFKKEKLIGVSYAFGLTKKEFKKDSSHLTEDRDRILKWKTKILKKYDDEETRNLFSSGRFKISWKKFPKVCYSMKA